MLAERSVEYVLVDGIAVPYKPQIEPLYDELANHLTDTDMAEVKSIVDEIQQRIERFERRFRDVE